MALVTEADFSVYDVPEGQTGPPSNPDLSIALALSDGTSVTVFDKNFFVAPRQAAAGRPLVWAQNSVF